MEWTTGLPSRMPYKSIESLGENSKESFVKVTSLLMRLVENVLKNPKERRYRQIRLGNQHISEIILPSIGGMECLFEMGFVEAEEFLCLPDSVSMDKLRNFHQALKSKVNEVVNAPPGSSANTRSAPLRTSSSSALNRNDSATVNHQINKPPCSKTEREIFLRNLEMNLAQTCQYEDKETQLKALSCIPISRIEASSMKQFRENQAVAIKNDITFDCEGSAYEMIFLKELLKWFKTEFFVWVNAPTCSLCNSNTIFAGSSTNTKDIHINQVEAYQCTQKECKGRELFPRYNHVNRILESRKGRCGEWAHCFTLMCRALGWDARFVLDNCDHVWTEVYSSFQKRWLHCDPCECIVDKPLLYEKGWKKVLKYVVAFSCDGVYDVTWRYTTDHKAVVSRRNLLSEAEFIQQLNKLTEQRRKEGGLSNSRIKYVTKRHVCELVEFLFRAEDKTEENYEGRTSGSLAWRLMRGEISADHFKSASQYVWTPTNKEITARRMVVKYSMHRDEYLNGSGETILQGWQRGVFLNENVVKKEELDWKKMYLCRTEGCNANGVLVWKFDTSGSGLVVDTIRIKFQATTFSTGTVRLMLCAGDKCIDLNHHGDGVLRETSELKGESVVTLKAQLLGGQGDVAWQHAQLFRVAISPTPAHGEGSDQDIPMEINIALSAS